jgi:phage shock protein A
MRGGRPVRVGSVYNAFGHERKEYAVFSRLISLLKAKLSRGMAKLETPEILAEQAQDQLETSLKKTKEALVQSITSEKMLDQQIKKAQEEVPTWEKRAAVAVQQNNDELARQCLQKKQEALQKSQMLSGQLEEQKTASANLKKRVGELEEQYKDFQRKKANLTARGNASDAMTKANALLSAGPTGTDKWEQKIAEKEFRAEAERQMSQEPTKEKFDQLDEQIGVDDELARLKAQMQAPKLITDQEKKD